MPREAFPDRNVVEVYDTQSSTEMEFYTRPATDAERLAWSNVGERKGKKIVISERSLEKQTKLAAKVITGFRKGDHTVHGKLISADSSDAADYYPDWKQMMVETMPHILRAVGQQVFAPVTSKKDDDRDVDVVIEDLDDPDLNFILDDTPGDAAPATTATASGATEAAASENP